MRGGVSSPACSRSVLIVSWCLHVIDVLPSYVDVIKVPIRLTCGIRQPGSHTSPASMSSSSINEHPKMQQDFATSIIQMNVHLGGPVSRASCASAALSVCTPRAYTPGGGLSGCTQRGREDLHPPVRPGTELRLYLSNIKGMGARTPMCTAKPHLHVRVEER